MPDFFIAPDHDPSEREATREYVLDMLQQLARLARDSDDISIAHLIEAVLAAAVDAAARPH